MTSPDTASAKMTIAIGPYKHQQQPFQFNDIDVIMDWNLSNFGTELANSIRHRNPQMPSMFQHQGSLPTANHLKAVGKVKSENNKKHHALPYKGNRNNYNASTSTGRKCANFTTMQRIAFPAQRHQN